MENSNLEFRKIPSLGFLYEVNSNGTIFRNSKSKKQSKIVLDTHHSESGYYKTMICRSGKSKRIMIHRVVAECWYGPCPDGYQVDHIDRNSRNNDYRNLRYATHSEQMKNRQLSQKSIERCIRNCYNYTMTYVAVPVKIKNRKTGEVYRFASMSECAYYLSDICGVKFGNIRNKLKKRRGSIFDYDVRYLPNA